MTYLGICAQTVHDAVLPADFLQNVQTLPSFTLVIWLFLVLAAEEQPNSSGKQGKNGVKKGAAATRTPLTRVPRVAA